MLILKRVAPAVYGAILPTMWGAIPGRSLLEAIFLQDDVVDMDPISLIISFLDVNVAFPNTLHRLLWAVWKHMGLPFQGFLQVYLPTRMYAVKTDVGTTLWVHPASGVPQGGAEGPFLFLLVTLPLAFYIRRTYPDVAPYPLQTTLLAFADDMAVGTTTARQPLSTTPDTTRATNVLHAVTNYLEGNQLLVHNVKSATMVHSAPPPPLPPGDPPMNPVSTATCLGVQQAATASGVTLPPNLIRQLTRTLVLARMVALSTQALAYFLQAVLNAAIGFQALHLTHPQQMLQAATTTVWQAWTIPGHRPTSLPAAVRGASPPYYRDNTDHLVNITYTAHTASHLHRLMHNHEPEVRKVFTLTLREAQYHRNTCPQYILHKQGLPTKVGARIWNHLPILLPHHQHVIQTNHPCRETGHVPVLHTGVGGGPTGSTTTLDLVGTTLHLVQVSPNQLRALQQVGTHHVPFLQHPEWPNKLVLESHMRNEATQTGHPQPTDEEVHKRRLPQATTTQEPGPTPSAGTSRVCTWRHGASSTPPGTQRTQNHFATWQSARQLVDATTVQGTHLLSATAVAGQADGHPHYLLEMWATSTSHPMAPPPATGVLPQHTNGPRYPGTSPVAAHTLRTGLSEGHDHSGVGPQRRGGMEILPGKWDTKHPAITFLVLAKHRSTTPEAPAYPVKHRCSQVQDWQTVEWTTFHPQTPYLLQYVYGYITPGHEGNKDYVGMTPAATEIIRQGVGVYATRRLQRATTTAWATTEQGARLHAYQPTTPCHAIIFADAFGTTSLTPAAGQAAFELRTDATG